MNNFDIALNSFVVGTKKIYDDYMDKKFPNNPRAELTVKPGRKYVKLILGSSVHAFVDKVTGDVLKPASWAAPAKGSRGNIFDEANGLGRMGPYGPEYNK